MHAGQFFLLSADFFQNYRFHLERHLKYRHEVSFACWVILSLSSADFFQNYHFQKIISGTLSVCQTVWIQIRTDNLSVLIWVQTVCKGYQQTTKVAACKERVKFVLYNINFTLKENLVMIISR